VEKGFFLENDCSQHAAETPCVKRVVLHLVVDQQFGALELAARHADGEVARRVEELAQSPVDEAHRVGFAVDHNVVRFDVPVHDPVGVRVVQGAEHLEHVEPQLLV